MDIKKLKEQIGSSSNSFYPLTSKEAVVGLTDLVNNKISETEEELKDYVDGKVPENIEISVCEDCIEDLNIEIGEYAFNVLEKTLYKKTGENTWERVPKGDSNIYVKRNLIIRLFRVFFDEEISSYSSWERGEHAGVIEDSKYVFKVCIKGGNNPEFKEVNPSAGDIFIVDVPEKEFRAYVYTNNGLVNILKSKDPDIYIEGIADSNTDKYIELLDSIESPSYLLLNEDEEANHRHLIYIDSDDLNSGFPIPYASTKLINVNESEKGSNYNEDYKKYNNTSIILGKDIERLSLGKKTSNVDVRNFSGNTYSDNIYRYNESNNTFGIKSDNVWKDYASLDIFKVNNKETSEESNSKLIALYKESLNKTIISYIEDYLIMKYKILKGYFYINPDICAIVTSTAWNDDYNTIGNTNLVNFLIDCIPLQKHFIYLRIDNINEKNIIEAYVLRPISSGANNRIETVLDLNNNVEDEYSIYHVLFKTSLAQKPTGGIISRPEGIDVEIEYFSGKKYYKLDRDVTTTYFNQIEEEPINDLLQ